MLFGACGVSAYIRTMSCVTGKFVYVCVLSVVFVRVCVRDSAYVCSRSYVSGWVDVYFCTDFRFDVVLPKVLGYPQRLEVAKGSALFAPDG